jgi:hypothetical protein
LSSWLLGIDVAGARYGLLWCYHHVLLCLAAKLSHMGGDADRLVCHLHQPMGYGRQARVQNLFDSHRPILSYCMGQNDLRLPSGGRGAVAYLGTDLWQPTNCG